MASPGATAAINSNDGQQLVQVVSETTFASSEEEAAAVADMVRRIAACESSECAHALLTYYRSAEDHGVTDLPLLGIYSRVVADLALADAQVVFVLQHAPDFETKFVALDIISKVHEPAVQPLLARLFGLLDHNREDIVELQQAAAEKRNAHAAMFFDQFVAQ